MQCFILHDIFAMSKKILFLAALLPVVVVAGCRWKSLTGDTTANALHVWIADCDHYIDYMSCIADAMGQAGLATKTALQKTTDSWKQTPEDQLTQICAAAIQWVTQVMGMYKDYNCTLEWAAEQVPADADAWDTADSQVNSVN